ncbi:MAG TPA: biotin/lipoyl-binding protein, partial [Chthoniobacteraceae bacterium]|nr:biotin/lipoyl-binding protein [Chthoniobacteraceae bacterium]
MTLVSPPPSAARTQKRPGSALRLVVWAVFALLAAGLVYLLFFHKKSDDANAKGGRGGRGGQVLITTATAKKGDIGDYIKRIGNVVPVHTASIFPQVTGVVKTVYYTEGQAIKEGDPLVDIDSSLYDATLLQAEGTLDRDKSVLAKDQMDLDRYEDAWKLNAIAK